MKPHVLAAWTIAKLGAGVAVVGAGETEVVVPGQRVKFPSINSGDNWLKLWR